MNANELRDAIAQRSQRQEEILQNDHSDGNPALTGDEVAEFDRIENELRNDAGTGFEQQLERVESNAARTSRLATQQEEIRPGEVDPEDPATLDVAYRQAFMKYLRKGPDELETDQRAILKRGVPFKTDEGGLQYRAQTVTTTGGGYLIPQGFMNELIQAQKAFGAVRSVARILDTPSGNDIPWPTVDDTGNTGELLAINTQAAAQDVVYGQKILKAYKYSTKIVLVPIELVQDSAFDLDGHLRTLLAERVGRITNTHFTTGDNSGKPQGVVPGAGTGTTAGSATAIGVDDLIELEHTIDPAYRGGGRTAFMFADSTLKAIKKLKDTTGMPIWLSSYTGGEGNSILGYPYVINQDMAAIATTAVSVLFGDFSSYIVRDVMDLSILRLVERYADYAQIGYIGFSRHDGRYVFAESTNALVKKLTHP